jgi:hypothetical protein
MQQDSDLRQLHAREKRRISKRRSKEGVLIVELGLVDARHGHQASASHGWSLHVVRAMSHTRARGKAPRPGYVLGPKRDSEAAYHVTSARKTRGS